MKVLMLSIDAKVFQEGSAPRERMKMYSRFIDELHIYVYTGPGFKEEKVSDKLWLYPSNSKQRLFYFYTGYRFCSRLLENLKKGRTRVRITSQEGMTNFLAVTLASRFRLPLEVQIHTDIFSPYYKKESYLNKLRILGYWLGTKRAKSVRVVSQRIRTALISKWNVSKKKIKVLPIYLDVAKFSGSNSGPNLKVMYPEFKQCILMMGRLSIEKNIALALDVMTEVVARYPKAGLIIVGDGPEKTRLESLVKVRNLTENVRFLPWVDDPIPYFKSADIFLHTSNYEGYGLVLVEAALCGVPIVTTDVGVVGETINQFNALIAPVGNKAKLVSHLSFLLQNESARVMMRDRVFKVADEMPEKSKYISDYKALWQAL
jgi:glycosyltransferase involved in cell wall biosynthesis